MKFAVMKHFSETAADLKERRFSTVATAEERRCSTVVTTEASAADSQ